MWDGEEREREKEREEEKDVQRRHRGLAASLRSGGDGLKSRITERLHGRSPSRGHGNGNEGSAQAFQQPERWTTASTQMRREPRVLHGYTLTKDVPFREVCEAIRDSAFVHRYVF